LLRIKIFEIQVISEIEISLCEPMKMFSGNKGGNVKESINFEEYWIGLEDYFKTLYSKITPDSVVKFSNLSSFKDLCVATQLEKK
jgi:hypothetical protein